LNPFRPNLIAIRRSAKAATGPSSGSSCGKRVRNATRIRKWTNMGDPSRLLVT